MVPVDGQRPTAERIDAALYLHHVRAVRAAK
jgi:hypothetical protein